VSLCLSAFKQFERESAIAKENCLDRVLNVRVARYASTFAYSAFFLARRNTLLSFNRAFPQAHFC
jgi:hypothetical protein